MRARKLFFPLILTIIIFTAAASIAAADYSEPTSFSEAVALANQEMKEKWGIDNYFSTSLAGRPVNENTWNIGAIIQNRKTHVLV
ncbi:MAG: hypothetical protein ACPLTR_08540, partial [Thermacetogeniaceae bacterium]